MLMMVWTACWSSAVPGERVAFQVSSRRWSLPCPWPKYGSPRARRRACSRMWPGGELAREVDGVTVLIEFLCETAQVQPGRIFRPKGEYAGSNLGAFNVRGAQLARHDYLEHQIRCERLDNGGQSAVTLRVANVLPYTVLKIFSFQDRHANKDAYDLIFTLLNQDAGPRAAGAGAAASPAGHSQVGEALTLLGERFADIAQDAAAAYAAFLASPGDQDQNTRLRRAAVATVRAFLDGFQEKPGTEHRALTQTGILRRETSTAPFSRESLAATQRDRADPRTDV